MFLRNCYTYQTNQTYFTISDFAKNMQWNEFYAKLNGFANGPEFLARVT
ncbi:MAG: hypothetical protein QW525_04430 [Thermoplasmatales archaeon]